jgi:hypothetical protein
MSSFDALKKFLPDGNFTPLFDRWLGKHAFDLSITRPRKSKLGDFRPPQKGNRPKITLNGNLGPHQFLTTFVHEAAHLIAWDQYGRKAAPHGAEWKAIFSGMLLELLAHQEWDPAYAKALQKHARSPKAAVGADPKLQQVLLQLDGEVDQLLLSQIRPGEAFQFKDRSFIFKEQRRTRALVEEVGSTKLYTIPLVARVERLE